MTSCKEPTQAPLSANLPYEIIVAHQNLLKRRKENRGPPKKRRPPKKKEPPTPDQMQEDYNRVKKAIEQKDPRLNRPTIEDVISLEKYLEHRTICINCNGGYRCPHYCCGIKVEISLKTWECKKEKF